MCVYVAPDGYRLTFEASEKRALFPGPRACSESIFSAVQATIRTAKTLLFPTRCHSRDNSTNLAGRGP